MSEPTAQTVETPEPQPGDELSAAPPPETLVEEDLLVQDISIDGMCGVY